MKQRIKKQLLLFVFSLFCIVLVSWYVLPNPLFKTPYTTILKAKDGEIVGGSIALDGQWRFPANDSVPHKFKQAILQFEDAYFYSHVGVNPVSLGKALFQNIQSGKVKRGGSTLSMQVIRLSQKNPPRTYLQKLKEIILTVCLEIHYSKKEILAFYTAQAPFGGNVVGLEAASRRYFGIEPSQLTWAQAALLAVLPNRPGLIYPGGSNQLVLKAKRDRLLRKMKTEGLIDAMQLSLALMEPLPGKPFPLERVAPHLLERAKKEIGEGKEVLTTIDYSLQKDVLRVLDNRYLKLKANKINNACIIVIENSTGNVLAYVGNTRDENAKGKGHSVDVITAKRSTGSVLKPFLYASMLSGGNLLPKTMVSDVPVFYNGFNPQNFHKTYEGVVPVDVALSRSLNVPAVFMLKDFGVPRFHKRLKKIGMKSLTNGPGFYGLALILGGADATLWELSGMYSSLARTLNNYWSYSPKRYSLSDIKEPNYLFQEINNEENILNESSVIDAASIWYTFDAMSKVYRPTEDASWELFETSRKVAWKTGTSFGHRDAWAIGVTPEYTVGVWVGNADGEGRPGLTGVSYAGPILFDVFNLLPATTWWYDFPYDETKQVEVCKKSGYIASLDCPEKDTLDVPIKGSRSSICPFHETIHLEKKKKLRADLNCLNREELLTRSYFVLPPIQEWYYKQKNASYSVLPDWKVGCEPVVAKPLMQLIYPKENSLVVIPREIDGKKGQAVFELAHRKPSRTVFWYVDNKLIGKTKVMHKIGVWQSVGKHRLKLIDEEGEFLETIFEVESAKEKK